MIVQVNYGDIEKSDSLEQRVHDALDGSLGHLRDRLTRVEVHLRDDSSPTKHTPDDKRCMMEARPAGMQPLVIEQTGDDMYNVVGKAADKLSRAVKKSLEKRDAR